MSKKAKNSTPADSAESETAEKPKAPTSAAPRGSFNLAAIVLAGLAIVGLLTYDFWGARWLELIGRGETSTRPHTHATIDNLREGNTEQAAQILELNNRLQTIRDTIGELQTRTATLTDQAERRLATLESLQESISGQSTALEEQASSLQALQTASENLKRDLAQNPDTLASIIGLIRERRNIGLPLENIPELLRAFAAGNASLSNNAETLEAFADTAIPTDSDLVADYRALRPQIAVAFGTAPSFTEKRNFWRNLQSYIASLVTIRKLSDRQQARQGAVPSDSLSDAVSERNFVAVYEAVADLQGKNDEIDKWIARLSDRNRADEAIIALQNHLHENITERLTDGGNQ